MKLLELTKPLEYAEHAFGTSEDSHDDLNETIRIYTEELGPIAYMRQVHGDRIVYADKPGCYEEADAIFTDNDDIWLGVTTADCVPVLISCQYAVAAVHCGWRGLEVEILPKTIKVLIDEYRISGVDIFIHIGPCISPEHYEVDESFVEKFGKEFFGPSPNKGKVMMDTVAIAIKQARDIGVPLEHICESGICTYSEKELLNSYRRNKHEGKDDYQVQISLIKKDRN